MARLDLGTGEQSVRSMIRGLGRLREPVELVIDGEVVAKLIAPTDLSDTEKQRIIARGRQFVEKARARCKDIPASVIKKEVDEAVKEVRARHAHRRH